MPLLIRNGLQHARKSRPGKVLQQHVGEAAGLDAPRVCRMEAGEILPTRTELRAIARFLKVKPAALYARAILAIIEKG